MLHTCNLGIAATTNDLMGSSKVYHLDWQKTVCLDYRMVYEWEYSKQLANSLVLYWIVHILIYYSRHNPNSYHGRTMDELFIHVQKSVMVLQTSWNLLLNSVVEWSELWQDIILCKFKSIFLSTRSSVLTNFWHRTSIFCVKWDFCLMLLQSTCGIDLPYRFSHALFQYLDFLNST